MRIAVYVYMTLDLTVARAISSLSERRVECLYYGSANIVQLLSSMPATVHDLTRGDDFVTDAWQMSGFNGYPAILFIKVHGEFRDGKFACLNMTDGDALISID